MSDEAVEELGEENQVFDCVSVSESSMIRADVNHEIRRVKSSSR